MSTQVGRATIKSWGNSIGMVIPKSIAGDLCWSVGSEVELLTTGEGELCVRTLHPKLKLNLQSILESLPDDWDSEEVDWGVPVGRELW